MITFQKKSVKIISVLIALVFVGSVVALALTQFGSGMASAAGNSNVGTVDYRQIMSQHPQLQSANSELQQAVQDAQKDFEEKSKNMSDQEKSDYYQQTQQRLQQKQQELFEILRESDGMDEIVVYVANPKSLKRYGKNYTVDANTELLAK